MAAFRLLYFRDAVLAHWEVLQADDLVEAVQYASAKDPDLTAEVWLEETKVAIIRASPIQAPR